MSLTKFTGNTNVISELSDTPTETAVELKAKFDEAGNSIKNYINSTLTEETEQLVANTKTNLQTSIANTRTELTEGINDVEENLTTELNKKLSFTLLEEWED